MSTGEMHFDRVREQSFSVAALYPGENQPFWLMVPQDALIGARVVAAIGDRFQISQLRVNGGYVEVRSERIVPEQILRDVRRVPGVAGTAVIVEPSAIIRNN